MRTPTSSLCWSETRVICGALSGCRILGFLRLSGMSLMVDHMMPAGCLPTACPAHRCLHAAAATAAVITARSSACDRPNQGGAGLAFAMMSHACSHAQAPAEREHGRRAAVLREGGPVLHRDLRPGVDQRRARLPANPHRDLPHRACLGFPNKICFCRHATCCSCSDQPCTATYESVHTAVLHLILVRRLLCGFHRGAHKPVFAIL